jgi:hypothetical protein
MEENNKTKKETFLLHLVSKYIFLLMFTDCIQLKQESHPKVRIVLGLRFEEFQTSTKKRISKSKIRKRSDF